MVKVRAFGLQSREGLPLAKKTDNRTGSLGFEAKLMILATIQATNE